MSPESLIAKFPSVRSNQRQQASRPNIGARGQGLPMHLIVDCLRTDFADLWLQLSLYISELWEI
jgi:hypothetical protein